MPREWTVLSEAAQLALSTAALQRALSMVAQEAERLAAEIEDGQISDQGGAEALRLLTSLIRLEDPDRRLGHA